MKYLITGITGFVGPHLANELASDGHEVHGLFRGTNGHESSILDVVSPEIFEKVTFHRHDLVHYAPVRDLIAKEKFDGIFHIAAQSHIGVSFSDPILTYQDNVIGTVNLIEAIRSASPDTILHYCSTSEVYGDFCKDNGMVSEDDPFKPVNPYACSKAAMDIYVQERLRNGFIRGFITRPFSHTGIRRGRTFSISSDAYQLAMIKKGLHEPVLLVGNLDTKRVVVDAMDMVVAYNLLMKNHEKANGEVFNICGSEVREMKYFTDTLIDISGLDVEKRVHPPFYRKIDIQVQIGDTSKLHALTGWEPEIPIAVTLHNLFDYWMEKIG